MFVRNEFILQSLKKSEVEGQQKNKHKPQQTKVVYAVIAICYLKIRGKFASSVLCNQHVVLQTY